MIFFLEVLQFSDFLGTKENRQVLLLLIYLYLRGETT